VKNEADKLSASTKKDPAKWWAEGVQFECQGSGRCCVSHGEFGFVYLTGDDRKKMAGLLKLTTSAFTRKYCRMTDGVWHLKDGEGPECIFLKNKRCTVYEARPVQCRTWPFWPEVMGAKAWKKEVAQFCPGVGKGPVRRPEEIQKTLDEQIDWENKLKHGF
jgi:Fe-S-cluster containining protein